MTVREARVQVSDERPSCTHDASPHRLTRLVRLHLSFVYRVLLHLGLGEGDADDGTQQVFLVLARRLGEIPPGRERAFLSATATRIADRARRTQRRRREEMPETGTPEALAPDPSPQQQLEQAEAQHFLREVLKQMPQELREVLVLYELEELRMREIAEALQIPQGTVASRIRRARSSFERIVKELRSTFTPGGSP